MLDISRHSRGIGVTIFELIFMGSSFLVALYHDVIEDVGIVSLVDRRHCMSVSFWCRFQAPFYDIAEPHIIGENSSGPGVDAV